MPGPNAQTNTNPYDVGLENNPANDMPLTPLNLLARAATTFPDQAAIIYGDVRRNWGDVYRRCRRLAGALAGRGLGCGDTVSIIAPNTPAMYEAHFGVPMSGAVLNPINLRLDAKSIAYILSHSGAKLLLADVATETVVREAIATLAEPPAVVVIDDDAVDGSVDWGETEYESLLAEGDDDFAWSYPASEWDAYSLSYTSGTTGQPKGVVYHHRGAFLIAMSNAAVWDMPHHPTYLWTLPMFHCDGWGFPWTLASQAGTSVCLRQVTGAAIYQAIADHGVDHLCGAPTVLGMIVHAKNDERRPLDHRVKIMTAGAPPPTTILAAIEAQGFEITHVYGLTETYGPMTVCAWKPEWNGLDAEQRAFFKSRQGVRYHVLFDIDVCDPDTMVSVPHDGETMGEIVCRGNLVMKGYFRNPEATQEAFRDGWFHTGDLAVIHEDGYIQIRDRAKDIIISGGENISSIEVEEMLYQHPAVNICAVVAQPHETWGETPCAFVELKEDAEVDEATLIEFCRSQGPSFKAPKSIVFTALPKTATGKIQKYELRAMARYGAQGGLDSHLNGTDHPKHENAAGYGQTRNQRG